MIVGLQAAATYMTRKGRPTKPRGLWTLLVRGRHQDIGLRFLIDGRIRWRFTEEELDRLIERVRPYRRREVAS